MPEARAACSNQDGNGVREDVVADDVARQIASGYATGGAALELGAVVVDGVPDAGAAVRIPLATVNRHGLVSGATGTGKTKTLQLLAEQLSDAGVPVLLADVKGDLSGMVEPGRADQVAERAAEVGDAWRATGYPVQFWSLGTRGRGVPVRATVTSFGPLLLAKVLGLNPTQESTLGLIFHWADQRGLALLDLKDLRAVIQFLTSDEGAAELQGVGGVSPATAGVILRALSNLEARGGEEFFGEPELAVADLMRQVDGRGVVNLLELDDVQSDPVLFSTFLMWLLAELFEELPEAGDLDRPKLVFSFDEAHLLFSDASKAFLQRIEQTVKLIRSKGVGIFFCTQLPTDLPGTVLSQLGARVQHAIRAFTPDDQEALSRTVKTFPTTEHYRLDEALTSLGTGEAIVTVLSEAGAPTPVAWTRLRAPRSLMGAIGEEAVRENAASSPLWERYRESVDRESAYERLAAKVAAPVREEPAAATERPGLVQQAMENPAVRSFVRSAASALGREITRGLFGNRRRR
ncbi:DUF853 family protein [Saccharopolyspora hordei]